MSATAVRDLPLFEAVHAGRQGLATAAVGRERVIAQLAQLATSLALDAGALGITVADIRVAAERHGLLLGTEPGRTLSYLPWVPRRAGLVATGELRRSPIKKTHGNRNVVYLHPRYAGHAR